jgi:uncharacterized membrane protein
MGRKIIFFILKNIIKKSSKNLKMMKNKTENTEVATMLKSQNFFNNKELNMSKMRTEDYQKVKSVFKIL